MKILKLKANPPLNIAEKLIIALLERDFNVFKSTPMQFIRNNRAYCPHFKGFIAWQPSPDLCVIASKSAEPQTDLADNN